MQAVEKKNAGNTANYINQLWAKYFPYWPLFLIILGVCLTVAWYKIKTTPNLYLSSTSILIKEKKKGADESKIIESLNPILTPEKVVENEIEIFRSKSLMTDVVKNLHLYAAFESQDRFMKRSAFLSSPVSIVAKNPDLLISSKSYHVKISDNAKNVAFEGKKYELNEWINTSFGEIKFVPNTFYDGSGIQDITFTITSPKQTGSMLSSRLDVKPVNKATAILKLELVDEVPERAESILNELIKVYNAETLKDKNKNAVQTLAFVEERLARQKHELDSIESRVQNYKAKNGGINISEEGRVFLANMSEADQRLTEINIQLSILDQVEAYVKSKDASTGIVPSTLGMNNEMLSKLLNKLYDTELQKEELKKTVPENNPTVVSLTDQIEKIRPSILENVRNQKKALESNRLSLQGTSGLYSSMLHSIPQKEKQLIALSRDHTIESDIYSFLLQKREEAALSSATQGSETRVVDAASTLPNPLEPRPTKTYLNAFIIGLLVSVSLISGKEILNRNVLFRHEIESSTVLPIISEIAFDKSKNPIIPVDGKNTILASQFRKLRTSLNFLGIEGNRKRVLVTSTISGEGKSFIAANLGITLATTGKKVVLLEFDLINPALSEIFNIHEKKGLSNYINEETEPEEIIKRSTINENLFIISSGPIPPNPSEMILSSKVEDLLNYLDAIFDYIIIDTAPVGPMTDAYTLSSYCDATLYVIRHKYTPKKFIQRIDEEMKIHPLKNVAIVFNGIRSRGFTKNAYGMGYGYGHEYIYKGKKNSKNKYIA
jgi:tyrosine-protein kinase Etk/Wzc